MAEMPETTQHQALSYATACSWADGHQLRASTELTSNSMHGSSFSQTSHGIAEMLNQPCQQLPKLSELLRGKAGEWAWVYLAGAIGQADHDSGGVLRQIRALPLRAAAGLCGWGCRCCCCCRAALAWRTGAWSISCKHRTHCSMLMVQTLDTFTGQSDIMLHRRCVHQLQALHTLIRLVQSLRCRGRHWA